MLLSALITLAQPAPLMWSRADIDITPPDPLPLGGYTERGDALSEPGDRLFARTVVLRQGPTSVVIVSFEGLTVPESLRDAVQESLPDGTSLFFTATHTHSAPDTQMLNNRMTFRIPGIAPYNRKWASWTAETLADGLREALKKPMAPIGKLEFAQADASMNRARREKAVPDRRVGAIRADGTLMLMRYSAHATLLGADNRALSGDWPGTWMRRTTGAFLPGTIGDTSPAAPESPQDIDKLTAMVNGLQRALSSAKLKPLGTNLKFASAPITLGEPKPHPEFATSNNVNEALAQIVVSRFAPPDASLTGVALGKLVIVGVPGEPTASVGGQIEMVAYSHGFEQCWVVSHTNGWIGYILDPADYQRGGYEATLSFHGPNIAKRVVEASEELLSGLSPVR